MSNKNKILNIVEGWHIYIYIWKWLYQKKESWRESWYKFQSKYTISVEHQEVRAWQVATGIEIDSRREKKIMIIKMKIKIKKRHNNTLRGINHGAWSPPTLWPIILSWQFGKKHGHLMPLSIRTEREKINMQHMNGVLLSTKLQTTHP